MPIQYDPKDAAACWPDVGPDGKPFEYTAQLDTVEEKQSKKGNDMLVCGMTVWHPDGRTQSITDYIVVPAAVFKLKQMAKALGRLADFEAGLFQPEDHLGATFNVTLAIEQQEGYDDKNKIGKYYPRPTATPKPAAQATRPPARDVTGAPTSIGAGVRQKLADKPKPTNPVSEDAQFADADIPF